MTRRISCHKNRARWRGYLYYKRSISLYGAKIFTDESFLATKRHENAQKDVLGCCRFFVFFVTLCGHPLNENWFRLCRAGSVFNPEASVVSLSRTAQTARPKLAAEPKEGFAMQQHVYTGASFGQALATRRYPLGLFRKFVLPGKNGYPFPGPNLPFSPPRFRPRSGLPLPPRERPPLRGRER